MERSIWRGTFILTGAALIIKVLSALYRLPYQNLAGDVGFYVYQQIYPFYALATTMAGFGFPIVLSKLIAEARSKQDKQGIEVIVATAIKVLSGLTCFLFLVSFFGAPLIARLMEDSQLVRPMRILSFIFLWGPFIAVSRGYFQGEHLNMKPTGVSQVAEQTLRVVLVLGLSVWLFIQSAGPYVFGSAAAFGSMVAPLASTLVLFWFALKAKGRLRFSIKKRWDGLIAKRLLSEGGAYTIASLALVIFQFVDVLSLVPFLHIHWHAAKALKGVYDRSFPFIQMGMALAVALATSSVPVMAKLKEVATKGDFNAQLKQPMRLAIIFGSAAAFGLLFIIKETNLFLFADQSGTWTLALMCLNILSASIVVIGSTMLQGIRGVWEPVIYLVIMAVVKLGLNGLLVPSLGIFGAAIATVLSLGGLALILMMRLKRLCQLRFFNVKEYMVLICALFSMFIVIFLWRCGWSLWVFHHVGRWEAGIMVITSIGWGAVVFLLWMLRGGLLDEKDMQHFPAGKVLVRLFLDKKI